MNGFPQVQSGEEPARGGARQSPKTKKAGSDALRPFYPLQFFISEHPYHDGPQENEDKTNGENLQLPRHRSLPPILDVQTLHNLFKGAKPYSSLRCEKFFGTITVLPYQCLRWRLGISKKISVN